MNMMDDNMNERSPEAIEQDLSQTRQRMDRTLSELERKMSPGQLLDQVMSYVDDSGTGQVRQFGQNLGRQLRDNPLPAALVGVGLAWLAASSRHGQYAGPSQGHPIAGVGSADQQNDLNIRLRAQAARDEVKRRADEAEEAFERRRYQAMAAILKLKEDAADSASDLKLRVDAALEAADQRRRAFMERAAQQTDHVRQKASDTRRDAMELFHAQPLLGAAAGVTLGAILGAMLPATETEDEWMGEHRDRLADDLAERGRETGEQMAHQAVTAAEVAIEGAPRDTTQPI